MAGLVFGFANQLGLGWTDSARLKGFCIVVAVATTYFLLRVSKNKVLSNNALKEDNEGRTMSTAGAKISAAVTRLSGGGGAGVVALFHDEANLSQVCENQGSFIRF